MVIGFDAKRAFYNFTGLGNYSRFILKALSDFQPDHRYVLLSPRVKNSPETRFMTHEKRFDILRSHYSFPGATSIWRSFQSAQVAAINDVELFHGLSNELPLSLPEKMKRVVTIHDAIFKVYPKTYAWADRAIYDYKTRFATRNADKIIAVSKQTALDLMKYYDLTAKDIEIIGQGCHEIFFQSMEKEESQKFRERYLLKNDYILSVGTIEERKNALVLVEALAQLQHHSELDLVLVGKKTPYVKKIWAKAAALGLTPRIKIFHSVPFADLPLFYQNASVGLFPSRYEGFGIPILEGFASKIPMVVSTASCLPDTAGAGALTANPDTAAAWKEAIEQILENVNLQKSLVEKGLKELERFAPEKIASQLSALYESC